MSNTVGKTVYLSKRWHVFTIVWIQFLPQPPDQFPGRRGQILIPPITPDFQHDRVVPAHVGMVYVADLRKHAPVGSLFKCIRVRPGCRLVDQQVFRVKRIRIDDLP